MQNKSLKVLQTGVVSHCLSKSTRTLVANLITMKTASGKKAYQNTGERGLCVRKRMKLKVNARDRQRTDSDRIL